MPKKKSKKLSRTPETYTYESYVHGTVLLKGLAQLIFLTWRLADVPAVLPKSIPDAEAALLGDSSELVEAQPDDESAEINELSNPAEIIQNQIGPKSEDDLSTRVFTWLVDPAQMRFFPIDKMVKFPI